MIADAVRYMSVHSWKQPDSHGHSGTSPGQKQQPARPGKPSSRAISAGGGRCWVRTNVGLADGFTDGPPSPHSKPLTCRVTAKTRSHDDGVPSRFRAFPSPRSHQVRGLSWFRGHARRQQITWLRCGTRVAQADDPGSAGRHALPLPEGQPCRQVRYQRARIRRDHHHDNPPLLRLETASRTGRGHSPPNSARAAVRPVTGDRRRVTPGPFGATAGSMPIKTLAAQIRAFRAAASRSGTEIAGLHLTFHQDLRMRSRLASHADERARSSRLCR